MDRAQVFSPEQRHRINSWRRPTATMEPNADAWRVVPAKSSAATTAPGRQSLPTARRIAYSAEPRHPRQS